MQFHKIKKELIGLIREDQLLAFYYLQVKAAFTNLATSTFAHANTPQMLPYIVRNRVDVVAGEDGIPQIVYESVLETRLENVFFSAFDVLTLWSGNSQSQTVTLFINTGKGSFLYSIRQGLSKLFKSNDITTKDIGNMNLADDIDNSGVALMDMTKENLARLRKERMESNKLQYAAEISQIDSKIGKLQDEIIEYRKAVIFYQEHGKKKMSTDTKAEIKVKEKQINKLQRDKADYLEKL